MQIEKLHKSQLIGSFSTLRQILHNRSFGIEFLINRSLENDSIAKTKIINFIIKIIYI